MIYICMICIIFNPYLSLGQFAQKIQLSLCLSLSLSLSLARPTVLSLTINTFCAFFNRRPSIPLPPPPPPPPKSSSINVDVFISSSSRGPLSLSSFDVDLIVHRLADIKAYNFFKAAGNRQSKDSKRKVLKAKGKFPMSRGNRYHIPHHYTNTQVQ